MHLSFTPTVLTLGSAPSLQIPALRPGQVLPASLLTTGDGPNTLLLQDRVYTAAGALPSEPGPFWVQVQTVEQGTIEVKVLPTQCGQDLNIQILFEVLGIKPDKEADDLIKHLLRWRLPLSRDLVQQFINSANDVPPQDRPAIWASRAFLQSLTLNKEPKTVDSALKYILRRPEATPDGQEAMNQARPLYPDQGVVRVLTFQAGQNEGEVFMISRYQGQKSQPADNQLQSLVIRLSTTAWDEVWIQLVMQSQRLTAKIMAEDSSFLSLAKAAEPKLKDRFRIIGWELAALTTTKRKVASIAELVEPRGPENYRQLDALV